MYHPQLAKYHIPNSHIPKKPKNDTEEKIVINWFDNNQMKYKTKCMKCQNWCTPYELRLLNDGTTFLTFKYPATSKKL